MTDLAAYYLATAEKRRAYQAYNYAAADLERCQIKERFAEITSQHEPLSKLCGDDKKLREQMIAVAFYVVVGRWPEGFK